MIYGKEIIKNQDGSKKQLFFKFTKKLDYDYWIAADIKKYDDRKNRTEWRRKAKEAEIKKTEKTGELIEGIDTIKSFKLNRHYLRIKNPNGEEKKFGVMIGFEDEKSLKEFINKNKGYYKDKIEVIDKAFDEKIICANSNQLMIMSDGNERTKSGEKRDLVKHIDHIFKNYSRLDPAKYSFCYIADKNMRNMKVLRMGNKSKRDLFVKLARETDKHLNAEVISNFHPIVIDSIGKGRVIEASFLKHLKDLIKAKKSLKDKKNEKKDATKKREIKIG